MAERKCRTCCFWAKPTKTKALANRVYPCTAPLPELRLPESVTKANGFTLNIERRSYMERDEGTRCPAWSLA
jgi:hypothetical protein